jgi:hypothetical protein
MSFGQGEETIPNQGSLALIVQRTCWGPFSALSTPPIAAVKSFLSICRELQALHTFASLEAHHFQIFTFIN